MKRERPPGKLMIYILIAVLYAFGFWTIGLSRPRWVLAMICGTIFFQEDLGVGGVKFSIAEVNTILAIPLIIASGKKWRSYPGLNSIFVYFAICIFSSLTVWRSTTTVSIVQMITYFLVVPFVFGALGGAEAACANALKATAFIGGGLALLPVAMGSFSVLGLNKNGLGDTLCAALLVGIELVTRETRKRKRWLYAILVASISLGLLATLSRGSWLGAASGLSALAIWRKQVKRLLQIGLLLLPILVALWWKLPAESREYATDLRADSYNVKARLEMMDFAISRFRSSPVFGVGVGLRKEYDSTNIVLSTLAETGIVGLIAFTSIFVSVLFYFWRARRWLPPRELTSSVVGLAVSVNVAKLAHGLVDHFWQRGTLTLAWGLVGMAAALISESRRHMILLHARKQLSLPESATLVPAEL
jgi:O-antigen ligase